MVKELLKQTFEAKYDFSIQQLCVVCLVIYISSVIILN